MRTDFDFARYQDLIGVVVFRSTFNNFEKIDINQAWSLAISGGQEDKMLQSPLSIDLSIQTDKQSRFIQLEWGKMFTNATLAFSTLGVIWCIISSQSV